MGLYSNFYLTVLGKSLFSPNLDFCLFKPLFLLVSLKDISYLLHIVFYRKKISVKYYV